MTQTYEQGYAGSSNEHQPPNEDQAARAYIEALCKGIFPEHYPIKSGSKWFNHIVSLTRVYTTTKGDTGAVRSTLESLCVNDSELARLMKPHQQKKAESDSSSRARDEQDEPLSMPPLPKDVELASVSFPLKDEYIQYSKRISPEGFEDFHSTCFWVMLSIIAGHRVAIDIPKDRYTSIMANLVARSSLYKKTTTAEAVHDVLREAGLEWLLHLTKATPEKLLSDMAGTIHPNFSEFDCAKQERIKRQLSMSAQRGWIRNEFGLVVASMMKAGGYMAELKELLLIAADYPPTYEYGTQKRGDEIITKPYLTLLGTMTPASVRHYSGAGSELWNGGLWARFVFACPPPGGGLDCPFERGSVRVPHTVVDAIKGLHKGLGEPEVELEEIKDEKGKSTGRYEKIWIRELEETTYRISDEADHAWKRYRSELKQIGKMFKHEDFDASYDRLPNIALKVAALAAASTNSQQIALYHWTLGQEQAEVWRKGLHQFYCQVTNGDGRLSRAQQVEEIIVSLLTENDTPLSSRDIMNKRNRAFRPLHVDSATLADMCRDFARADVIKEAKEERSGPGRRTVRYTLPSEEAQAQTSSSTDFE